MLGTIEIAKPMPIVRLLEVRDGADHLEVLLGPTQLPQEMQAAMTGAPAGSPWVPSASDLRTLDRQWDALRAADPARAATVENQLLAAGEYPPEMTSDPRFRDTALAIVTRETFPGGQIAKTVSIWSVRDAASAPPAGPFGVLSIASAPFPIPISLKGTYRGYRVDAGGGGLLARVLGLFSGCGRP
jgi:hypothetical protein